MAASVETLDQGSRFGNAAMRERRLFGPAGSPQFCELFRGKAGHGGDLLVAQCPEQMAGDLDGLLAFPLPDPLLEALLDPLPDSILAASLLGELDRVALVPDEPFPLLQILHFLQR